MRCEVIVALPGKEAKMKKINPPYAIELRSKPRHKSVVILTGAGAWNIAKDQNSISLQPKLLLPFGENPEHFKWPVSGRDCVILNYGESEPHETILKLTRCLLLGGSLFVLWAIQGKQITRVDCRRAAA
jgi:hypothetical protein